jgi:hypothetical protein
VAWSSIDGLHWTPTSEAPWGPFAMLGIDSGFVATGGRFPTGGTGVQYDDSVTGESWTSADGQMWQKIRQPGGAREIDLLLPLGDFIAGYGLDYTTNPSATLWITPTPDL